MKIHYLCNCQHLHCW